MYISLVCEVQAARRGLLAVRSLYSYVKMKLCAGGCSQGLAPATRPGYMALAFGFWTFGRVKSTTIAHFPFKIELALGFWDADERHARILEPPGPESV